MARGIVTSWNGSVTDVSAVPELFDRVVRDEMRRMRRCVTGFKELHNGPELDMIGPQVSKSTHWDCIGMVTHTTQRRYNCFCSLYSCLSLLTLLLTWQALETLAPWA